jgi:glycosyltransferase 2 family protein
MSDTVKGWLLRGLGPLLILVVVLQVPEPLQLLQATSRALGWEFALAVALNFLMVWFKVLRWRSLLNVEATAYPLSSAWNAFNAASYIGLLTPGRVGDLLRVRYVTRDTGISSPGAIASVVVDRLWDVYVLFALSLLGLARFSSLLFDRLGYVLLALGAALAFTALVLPRLSDRFVTLSWRMVARREPASFVRSFVASVRSQLRHGAARACPLSLLAFLTIHVQGYLLARALGLQLSFLDVVSLLSLSTLLGLLPISVSGVGVREVLFALLFPLLGLSSEQGISYGLLVFGVLYLPMVAYGFVVFQIHPPPLASAAHSSAAHASAAPTSSPAFPSSAHGSSPALTSSPVQAGNSHV